MTFSQLTQSDEICFLLIETEDFQISSPETQSSSANPTNDPLFFQKCLDYIYRWDEKFFFSSISISTYTVNFIILFHLTCTVIFLYTTRMMSTISFLTKSFEHMLNIGQLISFHLNDFLFFFSRNQRIIISHGNYYQCYYYSTHL